MDTPFVFVRYFLHISLLHVSVHITINKHACLEILNAPLSYSSARFDTGGPKYLVSAPAPAAISVGAGSGL